MDLTFSAINLSHPLFGKVIVRSSPGSSRIVDQYRQSVCALLDLLDESITPSLVLQVCHDVVALARSNGIYALRSLLQLGLFATGNEYFGSILDKPLSCHLAKSSIGLSELVLTNNKSPRKCLGQVIVGLHDTGLEGRRTAYVAPPVTNTT